MLLEPNHGRYDPTGVRRQYEGSSVQLGPDVVTWTPPTHRFYDRGGFSCPIGDHPGQAHTITKLRAAFPSRYSPGIVDRYVVTDTAGTVLGSFPSGEGVSGSSLAEHQAGWYPATVVRDAAMRAGLLWGERDFTGNATELQAAFPGVVPHARAMEINQWVQTAVERITAPLTDDRHRETSWPRRALRRRRGSTSQPRPAGVGHIPRCEQGLANLT